jgi:hypothetical protein
MGNLYVIAREIASQVCYVISLRSTELTQKICMQVPINAHNMSVLFSNLNISSQLKYSKTSYALLQRITQGGILAGILGSRIPGIL